MANYWTRANISRRQALRSAAVLGTGAVTLSLVGCGSNGSGSSSKATSGSSTAQAIDTTKGKPGGTFVVGFSGYSPSLGIIESTNISKVAGFTHSALLAYKWGRTGTPGTTIDVEPDLARSLPEQSDEVTYVFKLEAAKFHNGRTVNSEDVKYSYDAYATGTKSAFRSVYSWYDKVETPDPQTVVLKTKGPYAFTNQSVSAYDNAYILAKEHAESAAASTTVIGSGPFTFVSTEAPIKNTFRRNPDYFRQPYPYFDSVEMIIYTDPTKQMADFVTKQSHLGPWYGEDARDEIKRQRPDAQLFGYNAQGNAIWMRADKAPFNDKRVRQALSMSLNRKSIRDAISKGEGKPDQALSLANSAYPFHEVKDLGAASKYWDLNIPEAKKLLAAAGLDKPIESQLTHWDSRQATIDSAVLAEAGWKESGVANVKDITVTNPQFGAGPSLGNYDGMALGPGIINPIIAPQVRNLYWSPPEGLKPPTSNNGYVNNPQLSSLVENVISQLKTEERNNLWRQVEDILAEEQYRVICDSYGNYYFADPGLKSVSVPIYAVAGGQTFYKYWWFDKA